MDVPSNVPYTERTVAAHQVLLGLFIRYEYFSI